MSNLVTNLFSYLDLIWAFLAYAVTWITLTLQIILNPFLLLMIVLTLANVYVVLKSRTRKEIVLNYGSFISGFFRAAYSIVMALVPIAIGIITNIIGLINGILGSAPVTILGTGVSPGTIVAVAIIILLAIYSVVSF